MIMFIFTKEAKKRLEKLPKQFQERIVEKLQESKDHRDIFSILKSLSHFEPATHRLRIGNYRIILGLKFQSKSVREFWVFDVGHRKDIYR